MYANIPPKLKITETISNPTDAAEVFGFRARNMVMGIASIVMKESATDSGFAGEVVKVPESAAEEIDDDSELIVLFEDEVLAMEGSDFRDNANSSIFGGKGDSPGIVEVPLDCDAFRSFDREEVEIGN